MTGIYFHRIRILAMLLMGLTLPVIVCASSFYLLHIEWLISDVFVACICSSIITFCLAWLLFKRRGEAGIKSGLSESVRSGKYSNSTTVAEVDQSHLNQSSSDLNSNSRFLTGSTAIVSPEMSDFEISLRRIISMHIDEPGFSVERLCTETGMSHSKLHRKLRREQGCNAHRFLQMLRLEKACELLASTDFTVSEITYKSGFSEPAYFIKVFRRKFGKTPGAWRKAKALV
jgi:AraC-like DNA-binding protein